MSPTKRWPGEKPNESAIVTPQRLVAIDSCVFVNDGSYTCMAPNCDKEVSYAVFPLLKNDRRIYFLCPTHSEGYAVRVAVPSLCTHCHAKKLVLFKCLIVSRKDFLVETMCFPCALSWAKQQKKDRQNNIRLLMKFFAKKRTV